MIRVVIIDDHPAVRDGVARWVQAAEDMDVVATAGTLDEGERAMARMKPDVALIDIRLPDGSGIDLARRLRDAGPRPGVVLMTSHTGWHLQDVLELEGVGYLSKEAEREMHLLAIRWAHQGRRWLDPSELDRDIAVQRELDDLGLTPTERAVLRRLEWENEVIVRDLGMKESTLRKTHLSNIYFKLMVPRRQNAISWARERRLLLPQPKTP